MARLLPFYRTGGLLSGGGGGGPLGEATVWDTVTDWTDFGSIPGPLRQGDRVGVGDLVPGYGFAEYDGTDWRLAQGLFPTVADLLAFGELINPGAFAIVGTGLPTDPAYYYDDSVPAWARMADTVPFAWTLSSIADFSAVGLQDGDYGVLTQSGGDPVVVRYKAACPTAYASPIPAWISPEAYNATPVIQGYLIGSEDASARAAQGWTDVLSAGGTRSITGDEGGSGETRLLGEYSGGQLGLAQLACGVSTMLAGTKVWWSAVIRGSTTGSPSEAAVRFAGDGTNFNWLQQRTASGTLRMTDGSNTAIDSNQIPGGTGSALPGVASTPDLFVGFDTGSTGVSRVTRKGSAYSAARRPAAASVQNNALRFSAQGLAASSQGVLRVSYVIVVTY